MENEGAIRLYLAGESTPHPEVKTWKHEVAERIDADDVVAVDPIASEPDWMTERQLLDRATETLAECDAVLVRYAGQSNGWRAATEVREAVSRFHLPVVVWKPELEPAATIAGDIEDIAEAMRTTRRPQLQLTDEYLSPLLIAQATAITDDLDLAVEYLRDNPGRVTRDDLEKTALITRQITPEEIVDSDRLDANDWQEATLILRRSRGLRSSG